MKVAIFKSYEKTGNIVPIHYDNDNDDEIFHFFNVVQEIREMTIDEFKVLNKAISHFNEKTFYENSQIDYILGASIIVDSKELDTLIDGYRKHENIKTA